MRKTGTRIAGWPSDNYYEGQGEWDTEKSMKLAQLQKMDPTMDQQIASYANELMGEAHNLPGLMAGNTKDIFSMAQDKYLGKMQPYLGVRATQQRAKKNPMLFGG